MVAEVSLLRESGSLAQERLRLEHQEKLLKLRTEIAKAEAKESLYEEFNAVEEEVPDHPRKFTPRPHVERQLLISEVAASMEFKSRKVRAWRCWKPSKKCSYKWSNKSKARNFPKAEIMSFYGNPLNYYLFVKKFENSEDKYNTFIEHIPTGAFQ